MEESKSWKVIENMEIYVNKFAMENNHTNSQDLTI